MASHRSSARTSARQLPAPLLLTFVLGAAPGCADRSLDPGEPDPIAGETDGGGETTDDGGPPPDAGVTLCEDGDVRTCPDNPAAIQYCHAGWFEACPCLTEGEPCTPGEIRTSPCELYLGDEQVEECVLDACSPTWVVTHECGFTPLVFVPADTKPALLPASGGTFPLRPDACLQTDWPTADTPWLARDLDGDGRIDGGDELFGSGTHLGHGYAKDGFQALAPLDHNRDGRIDAAAPAFSQLVLWADADGDRLGLPGELLPLSAAGIQAIPLDYSHQATCDPRGNCGVERVDVLGVRGQIIDLHLPCR